MPNYRRSQARGGTFFFTVVTHNRYRLFNDHNKINKFRSITRTVSRELPFTELACVMLHDHIHSIWRLPPDDSDFSKRWGIIKSRFTKYLRSHGYVGEVWQKRFWEHEIRDSNDLNTHLDYLHYNPVKHGYVKSVIDWPHSTFKKYVDEDYYPINWGCDDVINDKYNYGE
jgi:putative transposase